MIYRLALLIAAMTGIMAGPAMAIPSSNDATWGGTIAGWTGHLHTASVILVVGLGGVGIALVGIALFKLGTVEDDMSRWRASVALMIGSLFTIFAVIVGALSRLIVL